MKDNLFDNIKESAKKYGEYDVPSDALSSFRAYASKRDEPKKPVLSYFLAGLLLLLLISSNLYWFLNNTDKSTQQSKSTLLHETQTDTVYITKYVNVESEEDKASNRTSRTLETEDSFNASENERITALRSSISNLQNQVALYKHTNQELVLLNENLAQQFNTDFKTNNSLTSSPETIIKPDADQYLLSASIEYLDLLPLRPIRYESRRSPSIFHNPIILNLNGRRSFLDMIKPKSFSLFGQYGFHAEKGDELSYISGNQFAVGFTSLFSNRIRGRFSVGMAKSNGELENERAIPQEFPQVIPPEAAMLDEIYFGSRYKYITLSGEYLLNPMRFIRPYFGINYNIGDQSYTDLEYKFKQNNKELVIAAENSIRYRNHFLGLALGSDINLSTNFDGFISASYNYKLKGKTHSFFQLNTGIQYHF